MKPGKPTVRKGKTVRVTVTFYARAPSTGRASHRTHPRIRLPSGRGGGSGQIERVNTDAKLLSMAAGVSSSAKQASEGG